MENVSKINILGIAPYEDLNKSIKNVSTFFRDTNVTVFTGDLEEGREIVVNNTSDYDAIISRGGTANLIRNVVDIPVIDIEISMYDILGAIQTASSYTDKFVIVGYQSITDPAHLICDLLNFDYPIITIDDDSDIDTILKGLKEQDYELILCDMIISRKAIWQSIDTILITSGSESIKNAFVEAIQIINYLEKDKDRNNLIEKALKHQSNNIILLDQAFNPIFSNVSDNLFNLVLEKLKNQSNISDNDVYYFSSSNNSYSIRVNMITENHKQYFNCHVKVINPPIINNQFGVNFQTKQEIEGILSNESRSSRFITEEINATLNNISSSFSALLIYGESGTTKTSVAYKAFTLSSFHDDSLITVNANLLNDSMWKFLLNTTNGPLLMDENTLLFKNIEAMSENDIERLLTVIKNTNFLNRNKVIFTFNTSDFSTSTTFNKLIYDLKCTSIYTPTLLERKNELNIITTRLLNIENVRANKSVIGFEPSALKLFIDYPWPGNFDQLISSLGELIINTEGHYISEHAVSQQLRKQEILYNAGESRNSRAYIETDSSEPTLHDYIKGIINTVLDQNNGNQTQAAKQLEISRTTLWRYLKED